MTLPLDQIDAFTDCAFAGNPAAVAHCPRPLDEPTMQAIANEMNLSETAFILPPDDAGRRAIRYFTPSIEVELCGHATLASAHSLWERGDVPADQPITFINTAGARLACTRDAQGRVAMRLPIDPPEPAEVPPGLIDALGVKPIAIARGRFDWLIELRDAAAVRNTSPDFVALRDYPRGIAITAPADADDADGPGIDFVSRFFAPAAGIDEDPVTGSAHCVLGPYWFAKLNKPDLRARQCSARSGDLWVRIEPGAEHVTLAGHAVTTVRGELIIKQAS